MRARRSVAVAVLMLACAACGSGEAGSFDSTRPSSTASPPAIDQASDAVLAAYREFWDVYQACGARITTDLEACFAAADPTHPDRATFRRVADGDEVRDLASGFLAHHAGGEVIRGELTLAPEVVELRESSAVVRDCYLDHLSIVEASTGRVVEPINAVRSLVTVRMTRTDRWRVSSMTHEGDGCTTPEP